MKRCNYGAGFCKCWGDINLPDEALKLATYTSCELHDRVAKNMRARGQSQVPDLTMDSNLGSKHA